MHAREPAHAHTARTWCLLLLLPACRAVGASTSAARLAGAPPLPVDALLALHIVLLVSPPARLQLGGIKCCHDLRQLVIIALGCATCIAAATAAAAVAATAAAPAAFAATAAAACT
eukprot:355782-Chlamydomonas_euryale.AAC.5